MNNLWITRNCRDGVQWGSTVFEECINFTLLKASLKHVAVHKYFFLLQIISIQIRILFLFFPPQLWHFARAASGLLCNIQLEICAQDFLYFTLLESPSLCVYMCRSSPAFGVCAMYTRAPTRACIFHPFYLVRLLFALPTWRQRGVPGSEGALLNFWGTQQVAMTIEYPGNQNHMKSLPSTVCKNFECASKQLITCTSIEFY